MELGCKTSGTSTVNTYGRFLTPHRYDLLERLRSGTMTKAEQEDLQERCCVLKTKVEEWHTREDIFLIPVIMAAATPQDKGPASVRLPEIQSESSFTVDELVDQEIEYRLQLQDNEPRSPSKRKYSTMEEEGATVSDSVVEEPSTDWRDINQLRIMLPSDYQARITTQPIVQSAVSVEKKLRKAMAQEHLDSLRAELVTAFGLRLVSRSIAGQTLKTRARSAVHRKYAAVKSEADAYLRTRTRLDRLGMTEEEKDMFLPLRAADLRPFNMESAEQELGLDNPKKKETKRGLKKEGPSWI